PSGRGARVVRTHPSSVPNTVRRNARRRDGEYSPCPGPTASYDVGMLHGTTPARASLARALSTTTIHRRMLLPEDLADHLLADEDEVLLALPGIPDDAPSIILVTTREVVLGRWKAVGRAAKGVTRKRAVPAGDIGGADYRPGLYHTLTIAVRSGRDLSIEPCTAEDDRKSTRLNSSHVSSSYAVFC